jgi:hypothetical protein
VSRDGLADHERDLYTRATRAYCSWCERNGFVSEIPNLSLSIITSRSVTLKNTRATLARYVLKRGRLVRS